MGSEMCIRDSLEAVQNVLKDPSSPKTPDMGGKYKTEDVGKAIAAAI